MDEQKTRAQLVEELAELRGGVADLERAAAQHHGLDLRLEETEASLSAFMDGATDGFVIFDAGLSLVEINRAALTLLPAGTTREDLVGQHIARLQPGLAQTERYGRYLNTLRTGAPFVAEDVVPGGQFGDRHLLVRAFKVGDGLGVITTDVSTLHQAHERTEHLNRVLRAIRDVNQLIVSEKDREALIRRACEILVKTRGYQHAWIVLIDDSRVASSTAEAGLGEGFASLRERMAAGDLPVCCRQALDLGEVIVTADPRSLCGDCPLAGNHSGATTGVTVRLEHDGTLLGAIGLAVPTAHADDPEELALVQELAGDLGLALRGLQVEEQRRRTVRELAESEEKYRSMLTHLEEGFYNATLDGVLLHHNIAFNRVLGFEPAEDLVGSWLPDFWQDPADRAPYLAALTRHGAIKGYLIKAKRRDGAKIVIQATSRIVKDEGGQPVRIEGTFLDVTERVQAEEARHRSEELLAVTLRSIGDAVIATDGDGRVSFMNSAAEAATGWPLAEAAGRPLDEVFDIRNEVTGERVESPVKRVFREGVAVGLANHTRLIRRDGGELPIADSGAPIRDEHGAIIGAVLVFQDITARRRVEASLRLKNQVFEDSIAALSIADTDGIITEVNPAFLTLWGYRSKEDALGGSVGSFFVNAEDAGPVLEALGRSGRWDGEFLARRADGATFISRGLATAMKNERGELIGYQSANLDVTAQRRAKDEIKLRSTIASIFLSTPDDEMYAEVLEVVLEVAQSEFGVFGYIDEDGALVVPSMTRQIWDKCQVPDKDIVFPRDTWGESAWPQAIRQKQLLYSNSPSALVPQGHVPITRNVSAPIIHQGEVVGLLHVANKATDYTPDDIGQIEALRDIVAPILGARLARDRQERARRRREEEIVTLNQELDQKVAARTLELTAANQELEAFAYSVSHDLRAPLRGIDGFSKALLDDYRDSLDETARDYLDRVRAGTQRMGRLIDDLLKLSRLTRAEMRHQRVDLGGLARAIVDELQRAEPERQVDLVIATGMVVQADRALLGAALENLLRNAWKFTGRHEGARIELGATERDGERVFFVRDDGAGFEMAFADKLFGAFQRLHDTAEFPGSGIGLAIVKRVISRHGGRIWAEAEVDRGATFYFTLPAAVRAAIDNRSEPDQ